jgi:tetratricopeptide (TPR) repeat protein
LAARERRDWLLRCDVEHDNFRSALDWLVSVGNAEWALRIGLALYAFWERREHLVEGRRRLEAIVNLEAARGCSDRYAHALSYIAALGGLGGDPVTGRSLHETALQAFRDAGNRRGEASALNGLGSWLSFHGDHDGARVAYEQAVAVCRAIGHQPQIGAALSNLAGVVGRLGDWDKACALLEQARAIFAAVGDEVAGAWVLNHLGDAARAQGRISEARALYEDAVARFSRLLDAWGIARSSEDLAYVRIETDDLASARELFVNSLNALRQLDHKRGIARVLEGFAYLAQRRGLFDRALRLAGAAAAIRRAHGAVARPEQEAVLERSLEPSWTAFGPAAAQQFWSAGEQLTLDQAVAYALDCSPAPTPRS